MEKLNSTLEILNNQIGHLCLMPYQEFTKLRYSVQLLLLKHCYIRIRFVLSTVLSYNIAIEYFV